MKNICKALIIFILLTALVMPVGAAFGVTQYGNVHLQSNRFVAFAMEKNPTTGFVLVTARKLHSQVSISSLDGKFTIKTKSGTAVPYTFNYRGDEVAIITFSIAEQDVYVNLIDSFFDFPVPVPLAPVVTAPYDLIVNLNAYHNAAQFAEWEKVTLTLSGLAENPNIMAGAVGAFKNFNIRQQYHMNFSMERVQDDQTEILLFEGVIPVKMKLPSYNKKYHYAMLEQLDARGVRVTPLTVAEENGFFYVNLPIAQNSDVSVVGYQAKVILPWWIFLLISLGGIALVASGIVGGILLKKHKNGTLHRKPKNETRASTQSDPTTNTEAYATLTRIAQTRTQREPLARPTGRNRNQPKPTRGTDSAANNTSGSTINCNETLDATEVQRVQQDTNIGQATAGTAPKKPSANARKSYAKTNKRNPKKKK